MITELHCGTSSSPMQEPSRNKLARDRVKPMSILIPVHASEHVLGGVSEYLATAFSLRVGRDPGLDAGMVHPVPPSGGGVSEAA